MGSRRRHLRPVRNVVRLDGDGVHRHKVKAVVGVQQNIEGLVAVVKLLDEIACETRPDADQAELRSATVMMRAALTSIAESAVDIAIGLGEIRALAGLEGVRLDGPEHDG